MPTILVPGDIAIVHYDTSSDAFSFVFLRDVEAGTGINFTDNGWLATGGFRPGEGTVTYTTATAITAGTIVTLTGLDLHDTGDQIIAYQGDPTSPTILHLVDFGDGNNTVAGDATDANTTALPPGFALGVNAVAVAFDQSLYAGPTTGSPEGLFAALNNSANWFESDALPVPFVFNAKPTIDLDSDNSTYPGRDYQTTVASGGPAVPVADVDVAIGDSDGFDIFAAEILVNGKDSGDLLTVDGSLPAGIVETGYNPATGLLRLSGEASHAAYEAAIHQVVFSTTDAPNNLKRILVSVSDGHAWSSEGTAFIRVSARLPVAPPSLDLDANNSSASGGDATATYTAGGPAKSVTDTDVTITDADSATIQSATITILGWALHPGDVLSIAGALPNGIAASGYDASTGVITLTGSASLTDYQTALHQVVYSNTLSAPSTADRGVQVTVSDGDLTSNITTMYMHVVVPPPNAAPVLDLDANNSTTPGGNYLTGFTEGGPPVAIADTDISIFDNDSPNLVAATITLTNPQADDVLTFEGTPPPGIAVSGSGTAVVMLTGVASSASYQLALQQIEFSNGNIDPSNVTRIVEVVVNDGTGNSNTATAIVQVEAANNSAPVIDLDPNDSGGSARNTFGTTFTENGTPIPIADTDTTITDLDSTTLVSATITLANQHPGDLLAIGPLPGGIVTSGYDSGTGVLTLNGSATLTEYEAALQQVLYGNTSDNPATDDRLVEVVVNDGANTSNVADAVINVVAVNDPPIMQVDSLATYFENAAPIALSPLATLSDVDDTELNDLVVRITGGAFPGDGDTLTIGGATSGTINGITFLWDPVDQALVLTGASLVANYQDLLRTAEFHSTSDNPTDFDASPARTLTWSVSGGIAVATATTTLDIVAVNDAPQTTVAATASYTENSAPVVISPASTATDVDDINLVSGEVRIVSGALDGDLLTVGGLQSGTFSGIDFSYDAIRHSLTFTGPAAVADYQSVLQAIAFSSTSDDPADSGLNPTRTLSWSLSDGNAISDLQTTVVSITDVNDAPVNTVPGAQTVNEDTALPIAGVSVADIDSPTLTTTLMVANGTLHVNVGAAVSNNDTGAVTLSGTQTDINAALAGLSYTGNLNFNGSDTLTVTTDDGATQDIDTVAITVNPVNDPPAVPAPMILRVNEDTTLLIPGVSVSDVDSLSLTTSMEVTDGIINVTAGTGATVDGNGTATITITGTVSQTNAALAGLSYRGNLNFNGEDFLFLTTNDEGFTRGTTILVIVEAINDAPANTVPAALSVNEDTLLPIGSVSVADVDSSTLTTTLTVTSGTLGVTAGPGVTANGTGAVTITGTIAEINTALAGLGYTGNLNFNGPDTLTVTTSDGTAQDIDTVAITVNAVNDAPVAQDGGASGNEDTPISGTLVATDIDSPTLTYGLAAQAAHGTVAANSDGSYTYTPNADFNGADSFTFTANDGTATSNAATISLTINPVNDAPVAQDGSASGNEDTPISGTLVATDIDSPTLTYGLAAQAAHGTVAVNPDGSYTYTPNADFNGADSFTFTANDGTATSNAATISLTVNPVNDAPVAQGGSNSGNEDTPISGTLLATDIDSPTLTYGLAAQAAHGTVAVNPDGSYTYTPNADFNGADSFTFTANDGTAASNAAIISLTVNPVNDAPVNTVPGMQTVNENTVLAIGGLSVADIDSPTLTTTLTVVNGLLTVVPTIGLTITGNLANAVTISGPVTVVNEALAGVNYTGNPGFVGADTLTIVTSDGASTDTDTVAITVNPVNDAPHLDLDADNSSGALGSNLVTTFTENSPAVALADADIVLTDDDPDLTSARFVLINAQIGDSLVVNGSLPAGIAMTVTANELTLTGSVSVADYQTALQQIAFSNSGDAPDTSDRLILVTVDDGAATSDAFALVHVIAVNDAPVAQDGSNSGNEDTRISGTLVAIDFDSASLTYGLGNQAAHGTVAVNPDGSYTYTPNADFNGADSFTFTANDGTANSNAAIISLTVNPVNDPPVLDLDADNSSGLSGADYIALFTSSGSPVPVADSDTLVADVDSPKLTSATITLTNAEATDLLLVNGTLPTGITGAFDSGTGILTLSGSASLAAYQAALQQIAFDSSVQIPFTATRIIEVVLNDGITDSNPAFSLIQIALPGPPVLDLDANDSTITGSDYATTFTEGGTSVTIADIDIAISEPMLMSATITLTNPLPGDLLSVNGTLPAGMTAVYDPATGVMTLTGTAPAAAYQAASDQIVYSNSSNNPATDDRFITVVVNDGINDSNTATAIVKVGAVNDPPVAQDGSAGGNEDTPISGTLVATDVDSSTLTYSFDTHAAHGTVVVNSDGSYTYTPSADFAGADSFTFIANDGVLDSNIATESLTVTAVNDAPVITSNGGGDNANVSVAETTTAVTAVHATDVDSSMLAYSLSGGVDQAAFKIDAATGALSFVNAPDFENPGDVDHDNSYQVRVSVSDGSLTDSQTLTVSVTDVSEVPNSNSAFHGDLGGDQKSDIIIRDAGIDVSLWQMKGFQIQSSQSIGSVGTEWHIEASADLGSDGKSDVLWRADDGTVALWQMNGAQIAANATVGKVGNEWHINGTGDFNGDAKSDILWRADDGSIALWQMNGSHISANQTIGTTGDEWHVVGIGDFNGDHNSDILWRADDGSIALWQMSGSQIAANVSLGKVGSEWHVEGVGDFNGDGQADILFHADDGTLAIWQMNNGQIQSNQVVGAVGSEWHLYGTADLNGDGKADILFRNNDGSVTAWEMNGSQIAAQQAISPLAPDTVLGVHHYDLI